MASYNEAFWHTLLKDCSPINLIGTLKRMVENQEQKVTVALVDDLDEHQLLESLLEESKPDVPRSLLRFDYLLRSPWRYPPLRWGSRFGRRHEPGMFYGSLSDEALYAEAAYYRFVFIAGMQTPFKDRVISQHTIFEAKYRTSKGVDTSIAPYVEHFSQLAHKSDYSACQSLGTVLREHGYEATLYRSARSVKKLYNIVLFNPSALRSRKHLNPQRGLCETHTDRVLFRFNRTVQTCIFSDFSVNGVLPVPA